MLQWHSVYILIRASSLLTFCYWNIIRLSIKLKTDFITGYVLSYGWGEKCRLENQLEIKFSTLESIQLMCSSDQFQGFADGGGVGEVRAAHRGLPKGPPRSSVSSGGEAPYE